MKLIIIKGETYKGKDITFELGGEDENFNRR